MLNLSPRFAKRRDALYKSHVDRARGKTSKKTGRIIRHGYTLPFDKKQFTAWLLDQFGGENNAILCRYCRRPIDVYNCQLDHGVPIARAGSPGLSNLDPVCEPCNHVKGKLTPEEFESFLVKLRELADQFHNGIAVQDITHRLESYSAMKATVNRAHASRKAAPVAVAEDDGDF